MLPTSDRHSHKKKGVIYGKQAGPFVIFFTVLMPTNCVILEQYVNYKFNSSTLN